VGGLAHGSCVSNRYEREQVECEGLFNIELSTASRASSGYPYVLTYIRMRYKSYANHATVKTNVLRCGLLSDQRPRCKKAI